MKKVFSLAVIALLGLAAPAFAQEDSTSTGSKIKHGAKKAWQGTKKGAKAVGNKTAELASKGTAEIADKKSDEWTGPDGQAIYVTGDNKYYWVNKRGKHIFVEETALKAKAKKED